MMALPPTSVVYALRKSWDAGLGGAAAPLPLLDALGALPVRVGLPSVSHTGQAPTHLFVVMVVSPADGSGTRSYPQFVCTASVGTSSSGMAGNIRALDSARYPHGRGSSHLRIDHAMIYSARG